MAARRLIIVMLVLLGVSTAIAIVAPDPVERTAETGQTGETGATGETAPTGEAGTTATTGTAGRSGSGDETGAKGGAPGSGDGLERSAGGRTVAVTATVAKDPVLVCVRPETRLILTLKTDETRDISIPQFGRTVTATRFAPAVFDLLLPAEPGSFAVEQLGSDRRLATVNSTAGCGPVGASQASRPSGVD